MRKIRRNIKFVRGVAGLQGLIGKLEGLQGLIGKLEGDACGGGYVGDRRVCYASTPPATPAPEKNPTGAGLFDFKLPNAPGKKVFVVPEPLLAGFVGDVHHHGVATFPIGVYVF